MLLLLFYRVGSIVVVTPKARSKDPWGGIDAIRLKADPDSGAIDWSPMVRAVAAVHREMLQRNAEDREGEPITLVIDELTTFLAENPGCVRHVIDIWTMGASAGIFLIVIATDINVRGWKIEGRRDVIDNLIFAKVEDGRRWTMGRIDPNGRLINPRPMETGQLLGYAQRVDLSARLWPGLSVSPVWVGGSVASPPPVQPPHQTRPPPDSRSPPTPCSTTCSAPAPPATRPLPTSAAAVTASTPTAGATAASPLVSAAPADRSSSLAV